MAHIPPFFLKYICNVIVTDMSSVLSVFMEI